MKKETQCEIWVAVDDVSLASASLTQAGFDTAHGDAEEGRRVPVLTIRRWRVDSGDSDQELIERHIAALGACFASLGLPNRVGPCKVITSRGDAEWLDVVHADSLMPTGHRILAVDEHDVDIQLGALAAALGQRRSNLTVAPRHGWGNY